MTPRRLLKVVHDAEKSTSSALHSVQRPETGVHPGYGGAPARTSRKCVEGGGRYRFCDGVCSSLPQVSERVERARSTVVAEELLAEVLGQLFNEKWLASFVYWVRDRNLLLGCVFVTGICKGCF